MNYKPFTSEGKDEDQDISIGTPSPHINVVPQQQMYAPQHQPQVNILEGPGYRLFSAQKTVKSWSFYLKIYGILSIVWGVYGIIKTISHMSMKEEKLFIRDESNETEEVKIDAYGIYIDQILDI